MEKLLVEINDSKKESMNSFSLPWKSDVLCYNLGHNSPELSISALDVLEKFTGELDVKDVYTLFITTPIDKATMSCISKMINVKYLYITKNVKIQNLKFIHSMVYLNQLIVLDSDMSYEDAVQPVRMLINKKYKTIQKMNKDEPAKQMELYMELSMDGIFIRSSNFLDKQYNIAMIETLRKDIISQSSEIYLLPSNK